MLITTISPSGTFYPSPLRLIRGTKGSITRSDTADVKRVRPLALTSAATGLLLLVLALLLGLALGLPSLRVGVRAPVVAGAAARSAPVLVIVEAGRVA